MTEFMSGTLFGMFSGIIIGMNLTSVVITILNKKDSKRKLIKQRMVG